MPQSDLLCRPHCGACCIAPSITQPFWGMPHGKPAGMACVHLNTAMQCRLFRDVRRPACCSGLHPEIAMCGSNREEALVFLRHLEQATLPGVP